jgi:hypothetical protein
MRAVVLYSGEDNYWVVECPSLPGCVSQGKVSGAWLFKGTRVPVKALFEKFL